MKHIFLFNEGGRAAVYGIGTYIQQVVETLTSSDDVLLDVIQLRSEKKEFVIEYRGKYRIFYFPAILDKPDLYSRNVWYILKDYIGRVNTNELVFMLNYFFERFFIKLIKADFVNCKIIYAIHYQDWCFAIKGNTSYFKTIISGKREDLLLYKEKMVFDTYIVENEIFESVDQVVCLSIYTYNLLIEEYHLPKSKLELKYNKLKDEAVVLSSNEKKKLKKELFISEEEKVILYVGRLDEIKGVEFLIEAFKQVLDKYVNCRLFIVGDGDFSLCFEKSKLCWSKITFTGRLNRLDLYKLYQIADIGIMPSFHEQCSYVFIEMMMFGIPVIGTNSTGLSEMIIDDSNGFKLELKEEDDDVHIDVDLLSVKIINYFSKKADETIKFRAFCRKIYSDKYSFCCINF